MRKKTVKVAPAMALLLVCVLVFGTGPTANATTAAAVEFVMNAHLPVFPCPGGCDVTSLSGKVNGVIRGTTAAPTAGVTVCANNCNVQQGPWGLEYATPPCFVNKASSAALVWQLQGQIQITGGMSTGAANTPLIQTAVIEVFGAVVVFSFGDDGDYRPWTGVGLFRAKTVPPPCDESPLDIQIIGTGAQPDPFYVGPAYSR